MSLETGPSFKNINPENTSDTAVYTGSLSMIQKEREGLLKKIDTLKLQGKNEDDLEVSGYLFNLRELADQEREIRDSMKNNHK